MVRTLSITEIRQNLDVVCFLIETIDKKKSTKSPPDIKRNDKLDVTMITFQIFKLLIYFLLQNTIIPDGLSFSNVYPKISFDLTWALNYENHNF